jgi:cobalt-zinc-cadmium efflux system membrane fusion protein
MKNLIIYFSLLIFLSSCASNVDTEDAISAHILEHTVSLNDIQMKNAGIVLGEFEQRNISQVIKVNGKIELPPQNVVSISIPLGGYLKSTKLLPGMAVRKGQAIATMEDIQYIQLQEDYLSMKEKLHFSEKEYHRQKELNQSKASSDKVLEQAELTFKNNQIALRSMSERLLLLNIQPSTLSNSHLNRGITLYSPINGYVSKVNVNIGRYIDPADVLFELIDLNDLHLTIKVFEKDLDKIFIGQKILTFNNAQPDKIYECEVILIGKDVDGDGSVEVHCHFEQTDKSLFPGMYMNGEIEVNSAKVYALPEEAVLFYEGTNYIFTANGENQFELRPVEIGNKENKFIEILKPDELINQSIVIKGAYALLMKMKNVSDD